MAYAVSLDPRAAKAFRRLDGSVRSRIEAAIEKLKEDPRPHGAKALAGNLKGQTRLRVADDWRIIYEINDGLLTILVLEIVNRGEAY